MTPFEMIEVGSCRDGSYSGEFVAAPEDVAGKVLEYLACRGLHPVRAWSRLIGSGTYCYLIFDEGNLGQLRAAMFEFVNHERIAVEH